MHIYFFDLVPVNNLSMSVTCLFATCPSSYPIASFHSLDTTWPKTVVHSSFLVSILMNLQQRAREKNCTRLIPILSPTLRAQTLLGHPVKKQVVGKAVCIKPWNVTLSLCPGMHYNIFKSAHAYAQARLGQLVTGYKQLYTREILIYVRSLICPPCHQLCTIRYVKSYALT